MITVRWYQSQCGECHVHKCTGYLILRNGTRQRQALSGECIRTNKPLCSTGFKFYQSCPAVLIQSSKRHSY